jgi:VWFA-related protein
MVSFRLLAAFPLTVVLLAQGLLDTREVTFSSTPYTPRLPVSIRVDTRVVEVPVVVRNGRGYAVAGLRREDFQITDDGKKREVSSFVAETKERGTSASTGASGAQVMNTAATKMPQAKARTRYVALVFDDLNSRVPELMSARLAAARFLKEGLRPGDQISVFTTWGRQVVPFTTNTDEIAAAVNKIAPHPVKADMQGCPSITAYEAYLLANNMDQELLSVKVDETKRCKGIPPTTNRRGGGGGGMSDPTVQEVLAMAQSSWEQTRLVSRNTLGAINDIVDYLARHDGERLMVYASSGFLTGTIELDQELLINRALHAGVVIDALDAKGLYTPEAPQPSPGANMHSMIVQQKMGTRPLESENDGMAVLAYGTGGIFFHNNNDLSAGLREMMTPETIYLLGFTPEQVSSNKYHHLKVRLASGHYNIQARPGYMATPLRPTAEAPPRKIDEAALATDSRADAPAIVGATLRENPKDGGKELAAVLHLDIGHMSFRQAFGIRTQRVTFIAVLNDLQGNFVTGTEYTIDFALSDASYEKYASGGFNASAGLRAAPGKYKLRGVADAGNGAITATTLDVEIP